MNTFPSLAEMLSVPPPKPRPDPVVPSRQATWKVKEYKPSLAMKLAQERARRDQPPLKSLSSNVIPGTRYDP